MDLPCGSDSRNGKTIAQESKMQNLWIYKNTKDNSARFLLGEKGVKTLICIGINASTAETEHLDNTLSTVKRFFHTLGYDSWLMLNVYPQRVTNPNLLHQVIDRELHKKNLRYIDRAFRTGHSDIWAAWGTLINKREYLSGCLKDIYALAKRYNLNWFHMGPLCKSGHPHHPLYLSKKLTLEKFDVSQYMLTLESSR